MRTFAQIEAIAAKRHGGVRSLEERFRILDKDTLSHPETLPDDRWLSMFTRFVFSAGFNWKVIDAKWPGFEEAFMGFEPRRWAMMSDDDFDALTRDTRIVRNAGKIISVRDNAIFLRDLCEEHGKPAGKVLGSWPSEDYVGLLALLKKRGSRLGGSTSGYALRHIGKDSFLLSRDVVAALVREGVVDKTPTSRRAMAAVQDAFNTWMNESGHGLTRISRTLAHSVGN